MNDVTLTVLKKEEIAAGTFELTLQADALPDFKAGMFANLEVPGHGDLILKRPFCLHSADYKNNTVKVAFDIKGRGTAALAALGAGVKIKTLMPLGNSFPDVGNEAKIMLVGGGTGVLPLLAVAQTYKENEIYAFTGFYSKSSIIKESEFGTLCKCTVVTTDDGSYGEKGYVTDVIEKSYEKIMPDYIFACGPDAMVKRLGRYAGISKIYVTLESRMGCGMGACLVCACAVKQVDGEIGYKRTCADGPVFEFSEVFFD